MHIIHVDERKLSASSINLELFCGIHIEMEENDW